MNYSNNIDRKMKNFINFPLIVVLSCIIVAQLADVTESKIIPTTEQTSRSKFENASVEHHKHKPREVHQENRTRTKTPTKSGKIPHSTDKSTNDVSKHTKKSTIRKINIVHIKDLIKQNRVNNPQTTQTEVVTKFETRTTPKYIRPIFKYTIPQQKYQNHMNSFTSVTFSDYLKKSYPRSRIMDMPQKEFRKGHPQSAFQITPRKSYVRKRPERITTISTTFTPTYTTKKTSSKYRSFFKPEKFKSHYEKITNKTKSLFKRFLSYGKKILSKLNEE